MKTLKSILLSLVMLPFIAKACDPMAPNCGLQKPRLEEPIMYFAQEKTQSEHQIKTQIAKKYPLIQEERAIQAEYAKNGYQSKDFSAYNAKLKKVTSQPEYKAQLQAFNKAVAKALAHGTSALPGHKPTPIQQSLPTTPLKNKIMKLQQQNIELAEEIGSTYYAHRGGPYEVLSMAQEAQKEAETQMIYLQNLLNSEAKLNTSLQKQLNTAKKYHSAAL